MTALESLTIIGSILALMGGFFVVLKFTVGSAVEGLRSEINGLRAEMNGLRAEMNARLDSIERRLDHLDGDVQKLTEKMFGH